MTAASILEVLWAQGFAVALVNGDRLQVSPASTLHDSQRELLRAHKPAIVALLRQAQPEIKELLAAAIRACDYYNDSPAAREQMRLECLATPPEQRQDLIEHFQQTYRSAS